MSYKYFENRECEFYPCHKVANMNCLFCFCPLYNMNCEGNYEMIKGKNGEAIKDCSNCILPHIESGYDYVMKYLKRKACGENEY